jgi:NAD+ kinase
MNLVGVVLKNESGRAEEVFGRLRGFFESKQIEYVLIYSKQGDLDPAVCEKLPACDLAVAFGGDGTLLFTSRVFSPHCVPIMGVNLGGLGFITEFRESEMIECVESFMHGDYTCEERLMLEVCIMRQGEIIAQETGLNDLVMNSRGISRLIELEVTSSGMLLGSYRADGIIIATPTGSTAYSLSAGGPILDPTSNALVINPICPHSLGVRPLVIPADREIKISAVSNERSVTATIDGQIAHELEPGDEVRVTRSDTVTSLVSIGTRSFYDIIREKLFWKG